MAPDGLEPRFGRRCPYPDCPAILFAPDYEYCDRHQKVIRGPAGKEPRHGQLNNGPSSSTQGLLSRPILESVNQSTALDRLLDKLDKSQAAPLEPANQSTTLDRLLDKLDKSQAAPATGLVGIPASSLPANSRLGPEFEKSAAKTARKTGRRDTVRLHAGSGRLTHSPSTGSMDGRFDQEDGRKAGPAHYPVAKELPRSHVPLDSSEASSHSTLPRQPSGDLPRTNSAAAPQPTAEKRPVERGPSPASYGEGNSSHIPDSSRERSNAVDKRTLGPLSSRTNQLSSQASPIAPSVRSNISESHLPSTSSERALSPIRKPTNEPGTLGHRPCIKKRIRGGNMSGTRPVAQTPAGYSGLHRNRPKPIAVSVKRVPDGVPPRPVVIDCITTDDSENSAAPPSKNKKRARSPPRAVPPTRSLVHTIASTKTVGQPRPEQSHQHRASKIGTPVTEQQTTQPHQELLYQIKHLQLEDQRFYFVQPSKKAVAEKRLGTSGLAMRPVSSRNPESEHTHSPASKHAIFDQVKFDTDIYGQQSAGPPPPGVLLPRRKEKETPRPGEDGKLYLRLDPRIHWPRNWTNEWYEAKMQEIKKRGNRKANWGRAAERMREEGLRMEALEKAEAEAITIGREPPRREPQPRAQVRPIDFGDVPEDELPDYVRENESWMRACAWMRSNREEHRKHAVKAARQKIQRAMLGRTPVLNGVAKRS